MLKPIDPDELDTTLNKFREKQNSSNNLNIEALKEIFNPCPKLRVLSGNNFKYININEIFYIEGDGAYSHFYLTYTNDKITACRNLKYFEEELAGCNFLRIHKTYIINKRYLSSYNRKTRFCILEYPGKKKELQVSQRMEKKYRYLTLFIWLTQLGYALVCKKTPKYKHIYSLVNKFSKFVETGYLQNYFCC